MKKLFLRLYFLVMLGALIIIGVGVPAVIDNLQYREAIEDVARLNYKLIQTDLKNAYLDDWQAYVAANSSNFGFQLAILPINDIPLGALNKKRVWRNEMVVDELEFVLTDKPGINNFFNTWSTIWRINDSDHALLMSWEESEIENRRRIMQGMIHYIQKKLLLTPEQNWASKLENIQQETGIPIKLFDLDNQKFNGFISELSNGEIISYPDADDIIVHFQPVSSLPYVVGIGPIRFSYSIPWQDIFSIGMSGTVFSVILLLFLWPLWRALKGLEDVTSAFGDGALNARITVKKDSPIASVITTFNSMADRIYKLVQSQKDLVNAVSHELRTPIASLRFGIEAIINSEGKEDQENYVKRMNQDLDRLDSLVEELLYYTRLDAQDRINIQNDVPLSRWLQEQINEISFLYPSLQFELFSPEKEHLSCDTRLMSRAITNILSNAARHAAKKVLLSVNLTDEFFIVDIDDDGPGIPVDQRLKAFEPFERLDESRDRRTGGHGLGLAIVSRVIRQHQGDVIISDSPLGGCKVSLTWPLPTLPSQ